MTIPTIKDKSQYRNSSVAFKCTASEKEYYQKEADKNRVTLSNYIYLLVEKNKDKFNKYYNAPQPTRIISLFGGWIKIQINKKES